VLGKKNDHGSYTLQIFSFDVAWRDIRMKSSTATTTGTPM
jgi:hypothetical protein